jgi:hypothetical protein
VARKREKADIVMLSIIHRSLLVGHAPGGRRAPIRKKSELKDFRKRVRKHCIEALSETMTVLFLGCPCATVVDIPA